MNRKNVLFDYFSKYKKTYIVLIILFLNGVILGTAFVNLSGVEKSKNLIEYANSIIENVKKTEFNMLQKSFIQSLLQNWKLIGMIWILGCTIIGSYLIYIIIIYRGFKIGYTIATFIFALGTKRGITFCLLSLLLQNIIYIPILLLICESSIRMCKETGINRRNLKRELIRHIIIFMLCLLVSVFSSIVEVYFSTKLLKIFKEIF